MRGIINFGVGSLSTLGVSQTLFGSDCFALINTEVSGILNTVISIIGGILSTIVVAYLQHHWRMAEDERKWKREHPAHKLKKLD